MSNGYHINAKTGVVGRCTASLRPCPHGAAEEHYSTASEARTAFEATQTAAPKRLKRPKPAELLKELQPHTEHQLLLASLSKKERWRGTELKTLELLQQSITAFSDQAPESEEEKVQLRSKIAGLHFAKELLTETEREILHTLEHLEKTDRVSRAPGRRATRSELREHFKLKHPDVTLDLAVSEDRVVVDRIVSHGEPGSGAGTKAMETLVELADSNGWRLALTPSSDFGGSKKRLEQFYKRFGFVSNSGRNKDYELMQTMVRVPKDS